MVHHTTGAMEQRKEEQRGNEYHGVGEKRRRFAILSNVIWQVLTDKVTCEQTSEKDKRKWARKISSGNLFLTDNAMQRF